MNNELEEKLTQIINRAVFVPPKNVEFELLKDIKSFWSKIVRVTIQWPENTKLNDRDQFDRLKFPTKLFIKVFLCILPITFAASLYFK